MNWTLIWEKGEAKTFIFAGWAGNTMKLYIIVLFTLVSLAATSMGHEEHIEKEIEERSADPAQIEVNSQQVLDASLGKKKKRKSKCGGWTQACCKKGQECRGKNPRYGHKMTCNECCAQRLKKGFCLRTRPCCG